MRVGLKIRLNKLGIKKMCKDSIQDREHLKHIKNMIAIVDEVRRSNAKINFDGYDILNFSLEEFQYFDEVLEH